MRLLVVTPEFPPHTGGGIATYYAAMVAAWKAHGVDVNVLVASPFAPASGETSDGVSMLSADEIDHHAERLTHLASAPLFRRYLAAGLAAADWLCRRPLAFDVVETTDFGLLCVPLILLAERPPVLVKMHGSLAQIAKHEPPAPASELDFALAALTESVVLPWADALYACSPSNAAEWRARLDRPVDFIPPPLPLPAPMAYDASGRHAAIAVGRIQAWKGPDTLCAAVAALGSRAPADLRIAWIGRDTASAAGGQSMSKVLARDFPDIWGTRVEPLGVKTTAEVAQLYSSANVVVIPSHWDTFNYALAEAMAFGRVVIASTGAGASYLIEDGRNGLLFPAGDAQALGNCLVRAHAMKGAERERIGAAARETIRIELDPVSLARRSIAALATVRERPAVRTSIGPWIREFLAPDPARTVNHAFLENVSIRELAGHLTGRLSRKVLGAS